jgi:hypothetical protein
MVAEAMAVVATAAAMAVVAPISAAAATGTLAAGTTAAGAMQYPVHFREAVFTAIVLLPDAAGEISARSGTPR